MTDLDKLLRAAEGIDDFDASLLDAQIILRLMDQVPGPLAGDVFLFLSRWFDRKAVSEAIVRLMVSSPDPGAIGHILDLLDQVVVPKEAARRAWSGYMARAEDREEHCAIRVQCLRGALSMAQTIPTLRMKLQAVLVEERLDDEPAFLRHVAKIAGAVLRRHPDADLEETLVSLAEVDGAADEASMELGLLSMEAGLKANDQETAGRSFRSALGWFRRALDMSEMRPDANLYGLCAELLVAVQEKGLHQDLSALVGGIRNAAFEYSAYLVPQHLTHSGSWLEATSTERFHWVKLGTKLGASSISLAKEEYLHAAAVIENELVPIFAAGRRIFEKDDASGVETIVAPAVLEGFQRRRSYLLALDQWVGENESSPLIADARSMRAAIHDAFERSAMHSPLEPAIDDRAVAEALIAGGVTEAGAAIALAHIRMNSDRDLREEELWTDVMREFDDHPDCLPGTRALALLQALAYNLIRFLIYRANTGKQTDPGGAYLFKDYPTEPQENDLQSDYYKFLKAGNIPGVKAEVRNMAGGRSDIAVSYRGVETVIETKKDASVKGQETLAKRYSGQAVSYQSSNARFSFLLVLDLTDRKGHQPDIVEQISVERKTPFGSNKEYSIVVGRIQGRRATPHALK